MQQIQNVENKKKRQEVHTVQVRAIGTNGIFHFIFCMKPNSWSSSFILSDLKEVFFCKIKSTFMPGLRKLISVVLVTEF